MKKEKGLSRREREIMDVIYGMKEATVQQVLENIPNPPGYSAVRALLGVLERKGHLAHRPDGPRYIYYPLLAKEKARRNALDRVLRTFFDGSKENIVAALLDISDNNLSEEEYLRLRELIEKARKEGR